MPGDERQETNRPLIRRTSKIALEVVGVAVAATALLLAVLAVVDPVPVLDEEPPSNAASGSLLLPSLDDGGGPP